MEKISTSLGCPYCNSSNVKTTETFRDEVTENNYWHKDALVKKKRRVYECICNECKKEYEVDHGLEQYVVFSEPYELNVIGDVNLLALYDADSALSSSYKIYSVKQIYSLNDGAELCETTHFAMVEGEHYPILLSKDYIEELENPERVRSLINGTLMARRK